MHTELHELHALRTVSTKELFSRFRSKETIQGNVARQLQRLALLACYPAPDRDFVFPCLAAAVFPRLVPAASFPASCLPLSQLLCIFFPCLILILFPLAWHQLRFPTFDRCFPAFVTGYKFYRLLFPTFATAYTFSGLGTDFMFSRAWHQLRISTLPTGHTAGLFSHFPALLTSGLDTTTCFHAIVAVTFSRA